jgi:hypothetical protein
MERIAADALDRRRVAGRFEVTFRLTRRQLVGKPVSFRSS